MDQQLKQFKHSLLKVLTVFLLFAHVFAHPHALAKDIYTNEQIVNDLKHLHTLLRRKHPNLYAHNTPEVLAGKFDQIRTEVGHSESLFMAAFHVQKTLAAVCDEHTRIDLNSIEFGKYLRKYQFAADHFITTGNRTYIDKDGGVKKSRAIHRYSGVIGTRLHDAIVGLSSVDGCPHDGNVITNHSPQDTSILLNALLTPQPTYSVSIVNSAEKPSNSRKARNLRTYIDENRRRNDIGRTKALTRLGINFPENLYVSAPKFIEKSSQDNRFSYIYVTDFSSEQQQQIKIDRVMRRIVQRNPEYVILDLTESPGGHIKTASQILSYFLSRSHQIAKRVRRKTFRVSTESTFEWLKPEYKKLATRQARQFKKARKRDGQRLLRVRRTSFGNPNYKGNLIVLISPQTHSAATMAALILKKQRNATIIGYQNGGSVKTSCFAALGTHRLLETRLKVRIPETCYDRTIKRKATGGRLVPDINVDALQTSTRKLLPRIVEAAVDHVLKSSRD